MDEVTLLYYIKFTIKRKLYQYFTYCNIEVKTLRWVM